MMRGMHEGVVTSRCNQCHAPHDGAERNCARCRARLRLHVVDRDAYLASRTPRSHVGFADDAPLRVTLSRKSNNRKLRGLPVTISSPSTCPEACPFRGDGCFAEFGFLKHHWQQTPARGMRWEELCAAVAKLPKGQLWRYAQAGDLPGEGDRLDVGRLSELVVANEQAGARGFTFTHKPLRTAQERAAVREANARGFTINVSANGPDDVARAKALGVGPVTTVVAHDAPRSPNYVLCPFDTHGIGCERCGLCAVPTRKSVVAFPAHGQFKARVDEICKGATS